MISFVIKNGFVNCKSTLSDALSTGAVEYVNCTSAEG